MLRYIIFRKYLIIRLRVFRISRSDCLYSRLYFFVERSDADDAPLPPFIPIPIFSKPPGVTPAALAAPSAPFNIEVFDTPVASLNALSPERPVLPIFNKSPGVALPLINLSDILARSAAAPAADENPFNNFSGSLSALAILSGVMPAACKPALAILNACWD